MIHIDCKRYAREILDIVKGIPNKKKLVILTVGDDPASQSYVKGKIKDCEYCGVPYEHIKLPNERKSISELSYQITEANYDNEVGGIIVQLPLPDGFDEDFYTRQVFAEKDVDGFLPHSDFEPCTPEGVMYLLRKEVGDLTGKNVLLIGRGKLVGEPLAKLLLDSDCTLTIAHSKTKNLNGLLTKADIVISAAGKPTLVDLKYCMNAEVVIDVGVNRDANGKLCGDCFNFDNELMGSVKVTPVPGGVGLMTRAMLMAHMGGVDVNLIS